MPPAVLVPPPPPGLPGAVPAIAPVVPAVRPLTAGPVPAARPPMPGPGTAPAAGPRIPAVPALAPVAPAIAPVVPPAAPAAVPARPAQSAPPPGAGGAELDAAQLADLELRTAALDTLDYFQVLKLDHTASPADIKRAFYRESRTYHPDRFFQLGAGELKERVHELYKRVTEAYYVLRDDTRRQKYLADITGPERARKLRYTEESEAEAKAAARRQQDEQIGTHPKGRQFFLAAQADVEAGRWAAAERNLKMALTYEPQNPRYKERLEEVRRTMEAIRKGESPSR